LQRSHSINKVYKKAPSFLGEIRPKLKFLRTIEEKKLGLLKNADLNIMMSPMKVTHRAAPNAVEKLRR